MRLANVFDACDEIERRAVLWNDAPCALTPVLTYKFVFCKVLYFFLHGGERSRNVNLASNSRAEPNKINYKLFKICFIFEE